MITRFIIQLVAFLTPSTIIVLIKPVQQVINTFYFHSRTALCLLLKYSDMQNRKTVWRAMKQVAVSRHIAEDKG